MVLKRAWIARDEDGKAFLYSDKPSKGYYKWYNSGYYFPVTELPEGVDPQWEDEEPIEVELKIEKV